MKSVSHVARILIAGLAIVPAAWPQSQPQDPAAPASPQTQPQPKPKSNVPEAKPVEGGIMVSPISTAPGDQTTVLAAPPPTSGPTPAQIAASVKMAGDPAQPLTRMLLIRGLEAEMVFLRRTFPFSEEGLKLKAGTDQITPDGNALRQVIANKGAAARPGDRGRISNIEIHDRSITFELNGGPKKKTKWWQRIQVGGAGGMVPVSPGPDNTMAHGSLLTLEFDKFVPELTVEQAKQLLAPVFDFSSKSATQAYADLLPPKTRQAIKEKRALVGMNHEMVMAALGRPNQKIRERDGDTEYEEWVYGAPPKQVDFVRFVGDEVVQIKQMTIDGQRLVRVEREVDYPPGQVPGTAAAALAQMSPDGAAQPAAQGSGQPSAPAAKPTLRRAGEEAPNPGVGTLPGEVKVPAGTPRDPNSQIPPGQGPMPPTQMPTPTTPPE